MLNLLWYVLIGTGVAVLVVIDEFVAAKAWGFSLEDYSDWFLEEYDYGIYSDEYPKWCPHRGLYCTFAGMIGLVLWPLRAMEFHNRRDERFKAYIAYLKENEEEEP